MFWYKQYICNMFNGRNKSLVLYVINQNNLTYVFLCNQLENWICEKDIQISKLFQEFYEKRHHATMACAWDL